jgi:hypothetical protein
MIRDQHTVGRHRGTSNVRRTATAPPSMAGRPPVGYVGSTIERRALTAPSALDNFEAAA